ncbi:MAG: oligopeptide:H+ symporter, partial [Pseudomonadota bacterium]
RGKSLLKGAGEPPSMEGLTKPRFQGLSAEYLIYIGTVVTTLFVWWVVRDQGTVGTLLYASMAVTYAYILWRAVARLEPDARDRIFAALFLITMNVLFWGLFEQAGSSLNVYADEQVDRTLFGQEVPASIFQSLNAMYIIFLGPVFAALWAFLGKRGFDPTAPQKFGLGMMQLGFGFLVLVLGANAAGPGNLTPVLFIFLIYLLHTTGELCLSPVGLSAMTRLSTTKMVGLIMGAWFLASGAGNFVAGVIAQMTAVEVEGGENVVLTVYSNVGWIAVAVGVGLIVVSPWINKLMHLDTLKDDAHLLAGESEIGEPQAAGMHPARKGQPAE